MCLPDGTLVGASAAGPGRRPNDHHTLFVATGLESKVDHVAFEVVDLDAVEMGQQVEMARRYRHAWGVGPSPRQSDLRLLARSVGAKHETLRRRRSVRR